MSLDHLISPAYREMQRKLHAAPEGYGGKGAKWADTVEELHRIVDAESVLDYGCGQGTLGRELRVRGIRVRDYDPAIAGKDGEPTAADVVVCTDVLEHIEEDRIDAVLDHIKALTRRAAFVVIALAPSVKTLSDGRGAHILLRPPEWWREQLLPRFQIEERPCHKPHKQLALVLRHAV